ncbi:MAG: hypothetical protein KGZ72_04800 [Roseovarius sp.]|jgi:hypothetical protein|nr:hypothetical protein [Roseovarius sp.]
MKKILMMFVVLPLSGCVAAGYALAPIGMAASSYAVNSSVDGAVENQVRAERMNCRQLQAEYDKINNNKLGMLNPLGQSSVKKASIIDVARAKGCRLKV